MKKSLLLLALTSCLLAACGDKAAAPAAETAPATQTTAPAADNSSAQMANGSAAAMSIDALLADPKVGDLYAAKLTSFSAHEFDNGKADIAYGLMKVVEVKPDVIVVITEDAAWDEPKGAQDDLHNRLDTITWDESERITVKRSDLSKHKSNGDIYDGRRL